ncbi:hypothetical protein BDF14DRAFT_1884413 [Spinellus fusiger]|nr:hypothetical protein BDF14DRAFT_1884413 [Spinellus fusiger]
MATVFFYGTLMSNEVLLQVLCGSLASSDVMQQKLNSLTLSPGVLTGYRRFSLKLLEYPGVTRTGNFEDRVNGILCEGLGPLDIQRLDIFEGEVFRDTLVPCQVYAWIGDEKHIEAHDWKFERFLENVTTFCAQEKL